MSELLSFPGLGALWLVTIGAALLRAFTGFGFALAAVPLFALIIEIIGYFTRDPRYDKLAYGFIKLLSVSFSFTASFGAFLVGMLLALYPHLPTKIPLQVALVSDCTQARVVIVTHGHHREAWMTPTASIRSQLRRKRRPM